MDRTIAPKVHFAPLVRQQRLINALLREGRFRNITHFMRCAIDHYLDRLGRPTLADQARQMAEDFEKAGGHRKDDPSHLQETSRRSFERW